MYLDYWMIAMLIGCFGACAYLSHSRGRRDGILLGIEGAFSYLERHKVISFLKDGSIKGAKGKVDAKNLMDEA